MIGVHGSGRADRVQCVALTRHAGSWTAPFTLAVAGVMMSESMASPKPGASRHERGNSGDRRECRVVATSRRSASPWARPGRTTAHRGTGRVYPAAIESVKDVQEMTACPRGSVSPPGAPGVRAGSSLLRGHQVDEQRVGRWICGSESSMDSTTVNVFSVGGDPSTGTGGRSGCS